MIQSAETRKRVAHEETRKHDIQLQQQDLKTKARHNGLHPFVKRFGRHVQGQLKDTTHSTGGYVHERELDVSTGKDNLSKMTN